MEISSDPYFCAILSVHLGRPSRKAYRLMANQHLLTNVLQEEVRAATDAWAQTLQQAHLQAIALCFNEALPRAPISDRLKLVSFLITLRTRFPTWRGKSVRPALNFGLLCPTVLSWDVIIEALMDDDFMEAYRHGIVLTCADGVKRRLFPRVFTYSADYPEKYVCPSSSYS